MPIPDPKDIVRRGYDAASHRYRSDDARPGDYEPWIRALQERVVANGAVLDLGCGCGVPVAHSLTNAGYPVTGVDLSEVQIRRARDLVPAATFIQTDATTMDFLPASFDAIVCLYTLIHLPLDEQPPLLDRITTWLRPGGWLLATTGHHAWTGTEDDWLGSGATMWWSHADNTTYRAWITHAGLIIEDEHFVPEGAGGHALILGPPILTPTELHTKPGLSGLSVLMGGTVPRRQLQHRHGFRELGQRGSGECEDLFPDCA